MLLTLGLLLVAVVPPGDNPPAAADDLQLLQGVWETEVKTAAGTLRVQVENRGNLQTLRSFRDGQLTHEHKVEFELSRSGDLKVFRWKNGANTFGPRQGLAMPDGSFIYRLKNDRWTSVSGLLPGEEEHPVIIQQFRKTAE